MAAVRPFLRRGHRLRGLGWYRRYDALFWDYASCDQKVPSLWRDFMYQADETLSEVQLAAKEVYNNSRRQEGLEERFKKAMAVMGHFYADPFVLVLRHKALPPGHPARAYDDSGWPVFETACASLATAHGGALHDLQHGREWLRSANRRSPEEMASLIRDESRITFTGKGDRETVARMYEDFYNEVVDFDARNTPALIQGADAVVSGGRKSVALIVVFLVVLPVAFCVPMLATDRCISSHAVGVLTLAIFSINFCLLILPSRTLSVRFGACLCSMLFCFKRGKWGDAGLRSPLLADTAIFVEPRPYGVRPSERCRVVVGPDR